MQSLVILLYSVAISTVPTPSPSAGAVTTAGPASGATPPSAMLVQLTNFAEWYEKNGAKTDAKFWRLLAEVTPDSVPAVLTVWGIDDPLPIQGSTTPPPRSPRVIESDSEDDAPRRTDPTPARKRKRKNDLDDFVVDDDAPLEYETDAEPESAAAGPAPFVERVGPDDVGKYYRTPVASRGKERIEFFRLVGLIPGRGVQRCEIEWLYRVEDLPGEVDTSEIDDRVEAVEAIGGVALLRSDHRQTLEVSSWTEITDTITDGPVPRRSIPPIVYYIVDRVDLSSNTLSGNEEYAKTVVDQLLTMGRGGGKWLKRDIGKFEGVEELGEEYKGGCAACGLPRTLSHAVVINGREHHMGKFCAKKVELAHRIHAAKTNEERHGLLLEAAEVNGAARAHPSS